MDDKLRLLAQFLKKFIKDEQYNFLILDIASINAEIESPSQICNFDKFVLAPLFFELICMFSGVLGSEGEEK